MVFSILALVTLPISAVRSPRFGVSCVADVSAGAFTGSGVITLSLYCATAISWTLIFRRRERRASRQRRAHARKFFRRAARQPIPARELVFSRERDLSSSRASASA